MSVSVGGSVCPSVWSHVWCHLATNMKNFTYTYKLATDLSTGGVAGLRNVFSCVGYG